MLRALPQPPLFSLELPNLESITPARLIYNWRLILRSQTKNATDVGRVFVALFSCGLRAAKRLLHFGRHQVVDDHAVNRDRNDLRYEGST